MIKTRKLVSCLTLSLLAHILFTLMLGRFGHYNFAAPVNPLEAVMVDLAQSSEDTAPDADSVSQENRHAETVAEDVTDDGNHAPVQEKEIGTPLPRRVEPVPAEPAVTGRKEHETLTPGSEAQYSPPAAPSHVAPATSISPPLRTAGEFLTTKSEKLTYLISLLGVPVGSAELEAKNKNGEVWITLRTRSNTALSSIYPVDDLIETRHINGNFIITKVRQQEGTFRSDIGYTIFLRDKRVFWIDRIRNRYSRETIPNSEVLDTLSSFYYLRNRPLQTGKTEMLHIYDGDTYAPVPIEIVRQEEVRLRNFKKVDALLLRHVRQKGGIFRRTGDMLIWLTNDENKVPVKVETTIPLGKVTLELVSAETQKQ